MSFRLSSTWGKGILIDETGSNNLIPLPVHGPGAKARDGLLANETGGEVRWEFKVFLALLSLWRFLSTLDAGTAALPPGMDFEGSHLNCKESGCLRRILSL